MELKNFIMYKKNFIPIFLFILFIGCSNESLEFDEDIYVEIKNCDLDYGSESLYKQSSKNELYGSFNWSWW